MLDSTLFVCVLSRAAAYDKKVREIFLKILTMDDDGAWQRNKGQIKDRTTFDALSYPQRIEDCERPENVPGPTSAAWNDIKAHLGTSALALTDPVEHLEQRAFGH